MVTRPEKRPAEASIKIPLAERQQLANYHGRAVSIACQASFLFVYTVAVVMYCCSFDAFNKINYPEFKAGVLCTFQSALKAEGREGAEAKVHR